MSDSAFPLSKLHRFTLLGPLCHLSQLLRIIHDFSIAILFPVFLFCFVFWHYFHNPLTNLVILTLFNILALLQTYNLQHEGLVVKQSFGVYSFGQRASHWIKLKKDLLNGIGDTIDVCIVGYHK
jgi:hypothetical protein